MPRINISFMGLPFGVRFNIHIIAGRKTYTMVATSAIDDKIEYNGVSGPLVLGPITDKATAVMEIPEEIHECKGN
jgi:hypothetical protein